VKKMPVQYHPDIFRGIYRWICKHKNVLAILVISLGVIAAAGAAFLYESAGPNSQWEEYSNYGISFNHPSSMAINTSAADYSNATYDKGTLQFSNPDHQRIIVSWLSTGNVLSPESVQNFFALFSDGLQKSAPDLNISSIQETGHSGDIIYYVDGEGHDITFNGKMAYDIIAIWEDPRSQRDFVLATVSYMSQDDAQSLFDGVLNSIECHQSE